MWEPTDIPSPCPSSFTAHNGFHRQTVSTSHLYQHPWLHWICLTHKSAPWHGQLTTKAYPLPTYPTAKSMSRKLHPILMCPVFLFLGVTLIFWLSVQQWCEAFLYVSHAHNRLFYWGIGIWSWDNSICCFSLPAYGGYSVL